MPITIIKEDKFRSMGKGVNENYDMVRIVMDMPILEWRRILQNDELFKSQPTVEPSAMLEKMQDMTVTLERLNEIVKGMQEPPEVKK